LIDKALISEVGSMGKEAGKIGEILSLLGL